MWNLFGSLLKLLYTKVWILLYLESGSVVINIHIGWVETSNKTSDYPKEEVVEAPYSTSYRVKLAQLEASLQIKTQSAKSSYESRLVESFAGRQNSMIYDYIWSLTNSSSIPPIIFYGSLSATSDIDRSNLLTHISTLFTAMDLVHSRVSHPSLLHTLTLAMQTSLTLKFSLSIRL